MHWWVVQTLCPSDHTKSSENLRLDHDWNAGSSGDKVNGEWDTTGRPEEQHQWPEAFTVLMAVVMDDLRNQLDAPTNSTNGTEDVGSWSLRHGVVVNVVESAIRKAGNYWCREIFQAVMQGENVSQVECVEAANDYRGSMSSGSFSRKTIGAPTGICVSLNLIKLI